MLELFADSPAALAMLKVKIPILLGESRDTAFALSSAAKDLAAIEATAESLGSATLVANSTRAVYLAAADDGWGER